MTGARVELCLDLNRLLEPIPGDVVVDDVAAYAGAYAALTDALHEGASLRVVVRHRACAAWLQQARAKYGTSRVALREITYRHLLQEKWGIPVPPWVTDNDLAASRLLELPQLLPTAGQSFEDVVLDAYWGNPYAQDKLPEGRLADMANAYNAETWAAAEEVPVAGAALARRLQQWRTTARNAGEEWLIDLLRSDPGRLGAVLSRLHVLRGYPEEIGLRVMGDTYRRLAALRLDLETLVLDRASLGDVVAQVQLYLETRRLEVLTANDLESVLDKVSGQLVEEFDWVEQVLRSGAFAVTQPLLDRVEQAFQPIRYRVAQQMADLRLLVEPAFPSEPDDAWDVENWVKWATIEYLPYRYWLEARRMLDDRVAEYASAYADWLYANFPDLIGSHERLVFRALVNMRGALPTDSILLFVILDNFGFRFAGEFCDLMRAYGYASTMPQAYISMLPSATVVSKKAMASGNPYPFEGTAYKAIVERVWGEQFQRKTLYLGRIGDLQELETLDHGVYVLNYTPPDDALHTDPRSTGVSHVQAVRQALQSLAESVHAFALRFGVEDVLRVAVCSDHGSTLIPGCAPNLVDAELIAKRVDDVHHRYVALTDAELESLPQSVLDQCYIFRRAQFQLGTNYLAARGYGRFRRDDNASYVHGGLTPEETLVPYVVFSRSHVTVVPPTVRLKENVFRYGTRSRLVFEIANTNSLPLQNMSIEISQPRGAASPLALETTIGGKEIAEATMEGVRFRRRGNDDLSRITIVLTYECAGQQLREEYSLPISMRHIMTSSVDPDLFGGV